MQRTEDCRKGMETTKRKGLEIRAEQRDRQTGGQARRRNQTLCGREIKFSGKEAQGKERGGSWGGVGAERRGQGISNSILSSRDMNYVAGELRDVGQVVLLPGGTGGRGPEQGIHGGDVVGEQGELPPLQEEPEMTD